MRPGDTGWGFIQQGGNFPLGKKPIALIFFFWQAARGQMEKAIQVSLLLSVFIYGICHFAVFTCALSQRCAKIHPGGNNNCRT